MYAWAISLAFSGSMGSAHIHVDDVRSVKTVNKGFIIGFYFY